MEKLKFKGTPGPWVKNGYFVTDINQVRIATINARMDEREEVENARLIVAAPEILDVLQEIVSSWENPRDLYETSEQYLDGMKSLMEEAKQVIKKALEE